MKKNKSILYVLFSLVLSLVMLTGCVAPTQNTAAKTPEAPAAALAAEPEGMTGGVLCLKINPEIALHYDETGKVTKLEGRNADGEKILEGMADYTGKDTTQVLSELVELIGKAGYFVEEADGQARKIVLELDPGSQVPSERFLEDMAAHVKACVENKSWVGQREYEYLEKQVTSPTTPATKPTTASTSGSTVSSTVPAGLCPICADDDCDEGAYCDDADDKTENLREYENRKNGTPCQICGDYDCDDGDFCDDADEKAENVRENAAKKTTTVKTRCAVCGDDDCDDGKYCDDWDDRCDDDDDHHDDHHDD